MCASCVFVCNLLLIDATLRRHVSTTCALRTSAALPRCNNGSLLLPCWSCIGGSSVLPRNHGASGGAVGRVGGRSCVARALTKLYLLIDSGIAGCHHGERPSAQAAAGRREPWPAAAARAANRDRRRNANGGRGRVRVGATEALVHQGDARVGRCHHLFLCACCACSRPSKVVCPVLSDRVVTSAPLALLLISTRASRWTAEPPSRFGSGRSASPPGCCCCPSSLAEAAAAPHGRHSTAGSAAQQESGENAHERKWPN